MDKDIDRALALAGESNYTNVWWPNDIEEGRTLLRKLARRLQASEARVAELEKENEKYRSAFRTIQERRGKKFGGAHANFVVFDEYGKAICVLPEGNIHHPDQNK